MAIQRSAYVLPNVRRCASHVLGLSEPISGLAVSGAANAYGPAYISGGGGGAVGVDDNREDTS